jgi:Flp pilus assembly protein TadB
VALVPSGEPRLAIVLPPRSAPPARGRDPRTTTWAAAVLAAFGAVLVWPSGAGIVGAVACLVLLPIVVGRLETRTQRGLREDLARQAPVVVDLLAATLASGSAMRPALAAVCAAVDQPAQGVLRPVVAALDLGADAITAWEPLAQDPVLGPVAAAVIRSARTGAPLSAMLSRVAGDLRRERRTVVEVAARTAGIRAVLPLAACFLPAFVLLGVVPIVAALATGLLG